MLIKHKHSGFTLVEVIVAAMIFSILAAGLYASMSSLRQPAAVTTKKITAALIGQQILEDLRSKVDASNWNSGELSLSPPPHAMTPVVGPDGITYTPVYTVEDDPNGSGARKVTITVTW